MWAGCRCHEWPLESTIVTSQHFPIHHRPCATIWCQDVASQQDLHLPYPWIQIPYLQKHQSGALVQSYVLWVLPEDWLAKDPQNHPWVQCSMAWSMTTLPVICQFNLPSAIWQTSQLLEEHHPLGSPADQFECSNVLPRLWVL